MTTSWLAVHFWLSSVVEAYRLDRYDNRNVHVLGSNCGVVEAYRLDRYDNVRIFIFCICICVVEAYRLDRYDNCLSSYPYVRQECCRSLSFG